MKRRLDKSTQLPKRALRRGIKKRGRSEGCQQGATRVISHFASSSSCELDEAGLEVGSSNGSVLGSAASGGPPVAPSSSAAEADVAMFPLANNAAIGVEALEVITSVDIGLGTTVENIGPPKIGDVGGELGDCGDGLPVLSEPRLDKLRINLPGPVVSPANSPALLLLSIEGARIIVGAEGRPGEGFLAAW